MRSAVAVALVLLACGCRGSAQTVPSTGYRALAAKSSAQDETSRLDARLKELPSSSAHPGKRPWTRGEVEERLDTMAAKAPEGLVAMGTYARERSREPIDMSDPRSAWGGGPEPSLGTFDDGAMLLLAGRVRELGTAAKSAADVDAIYTDIATMPLPVFSNSGGMTDGREQRERLVRELEGAVSSGLRDAIASARAKTPFRSNRDTGSTP